MDGALEGAKAAAPGRPPVAASNAEGPPSAGPSAPRRRGPRARDKIPTPLSGLIRPSDRQPSLDDAVSQNGTDHPSPRALLSGGPGPAGDEGRTLGPSSRRSHSLGPRRPDLDLPLRRSPPPRLIPAPRPLPPSP